LTRARERQKGWFFDDPWHGIVKIERRGELRAYGDFLLIPTHPIKKERTDTDITLIHALTELD
jgi:hypothetical protein